MMFGHTHQNEETEWPRRWLITCSCFLDFRTVSPHVVNELQSGLSCLVGVGGTVLSVIWALLLFLPYHLSLPLYSPGPGQVKCRISFLLLVPCIYYGNNLKFSLKCRIVAMHVYPRELSPFF